MRESIGAVRGQVLRLDQRMADVKGDDATASSLKVS